MTSRNKKDKRRASALLLCAAFACALPGCARKPSGQMTHFADRFLSSADEAYAKMRAENKKIAHCKTACDDAGPIENNPAYSLLVTAKEELDMYDVRAREYRSASKETGQTEADKAAEKNLEAVRGAFSLCAYRLSFDVRDKLPGYRVWDGAKPGDVMNKTRASLGITAAGDPPGDACAKYESLAASARAKLVPGKGK